MPLPTTVDLKLGQATGVEDMGITTYTHDDLPGVEFSVPANLMNQLMDLEDLIPFLTGRFHERLEELEVERRENVVRNAAIDFIFSTYTALLKAHVTAQSHTTM